ncbi:MAG TPA: polysaccharide deacetylase family protein [Anaerolineae bacterium]|nr:polysaccharide deacetylase family protein [Anaerolineae bacterium]
MKNHRPLLLFLLCLLLLTAACDSSAIRDLPVVSQFLPETPTPTLLPTATSTVTPTAVPTPTFTASASPTSTPTTVPTATATLAPSPPPPPSAVEISRGNPERPSIALTFDAGASIAAWPSILETLREKDVHCTFFITGIVLRQAGGAELLRQALAEGHELGNHSDAHPMFTELTDERIAQELAALEELVVEATGHSTKPYFRPPSGNRDDRVRRVVQENGYLNIYWTYHVWDWTGDRTAQQICDYAVDGACNGAIVVMHVGAQETADALPTIIDKLRARGYRLVTLSELLAS